MENENKDTSIEISYTVTRKDAIEIASYIYFKEIGFLRFFFKGIASFMILFIMISIIGCFVLIPLLGVPLYNCELLYYGYLVLDRLLFYFNIAIFFAALCCIFSSILLFYSIFKNLVFLERRVAIHNNKIYQVCRNTLVDIELSNKYKIKETKNFLIMYPTSIKINKNHLPFLFNSVNAKEIEKMVIIPKNSQEYIKIKTIIKEEN